MKPNLDGSHLKQVNGHFFLILFSSHFGLSSGHFTGSVSTARIFSGQFAACFFFIPLSLRSRWHHEPISAACLESPRVTQVVCRTLGFGSRGLSCNTTFASGSILTW